MKKRCPNPHSGHRACTGDRGSLRPGGDELRARKRRRCSDRRCLVGRGDRRSEGGARTGGVSGTSRRHSYRRHSVQRQRPADHARRSLGREMFRSGSWAHAVYSILRPVPQSIDLNGATRLDIQVILVPTDRSINQGLRFIALVYLCIGIYVLFRRWTAPKSIHFYVFCLASFVLYSFRSTGELGWVDWGNMVAQALQPALFLHFAVSFSNSDASDQRDRFRRRLICTLLYVPGALLLALQYTAIHFWSATEVLLHRLDQISLGYLALYYVIAAIVFWFRYRRAESALERQQLKWLTPRHPACRCSVHAVLRHTLSCRLGVACHADQARRVLACHSAADLQLGHRPVSADGRRSHLQARRHVHACDGLAGRVLLRDRRGHRRGRP